MESSEVDWHIRKVGKLVHYFVHLLVQTIQARFDQPGCKMYGCIEALLKAIHKGDYSEELKQMLEVYSTDLSESSSKTHLNIFSSNVSNYDKISNNYL